MNFGEALEHIKKGEKVARATWEKGLFLYLVQSTTIPAANLRSEAREHLYKDQSDMIRIDAHIDMRLNDDSIIVGWTPTQWEILSEDWEVVR